MLSQHEATKSLVKFSAERFGVPACKGQYFLTACLVACFELYDGLADQLCQCFHTAPCY